MEEFCAYSGVVSMRLPLTLYVCLISGLCTGFNVHTIRHTDNRVQSRDSPATWNGLSSRGAATRHSRYKLSRPVQQLSC